MTALNSLDDLREHDRPMPRASLPSLPLVESEDNNPQIWVLSGDPATEGAIVMNAVSLLTKIKVDLISAMAHSEIIRLLDQQSLALPQILVFGLSHTASASQVLNWFAQSRFTRKVLVVPETSNAPITEIVNRWGLNGVITLPCTSQQLANQLEELLTPTNSCEMLADNAQVLRVHLHYVLAPTIVRVKINGSSIKVTYNDKGLVDILGLKVVP